MALAGCRSAPQKGEGTAPAAEPAEKESGQAEAALDTAAMDKKAQGEFASVMYARHLELAREYRDGLDLDRALAEVDNALRYEPGSEDGSRLRNEILRLMGKRAGETGTIVEDQLAGFAAKREEQKVTVRRLVADGQQAMEAGEYEMASDALERALFIVGSANLSPLGTDEDLSKLGREAEALQKEVERRDAGAKADQEMKDTERALKRVAEAEEKQMLEARDRRARTLSAAIDAFNREDFDLAESYAGEVLREEPDNTVAHDVLENARRARHQEMNAAYLRELKDSFRRWQVDIEATKVPFAQILRWPSQSFWDHISAVRATRNVAGGGFEMTAEEQALANVLDTQKISLPLEEDTPFPQVVEYLSAASGVNFVIDPRAHDAVDATTVLLQANDVTIRGALDLILLQVSGDGSIIYQISGNVVRFLKKEDAKQNLVLRIHHVADLTMGITDFIPPKITLVTASEDEEAPLFGGVGDEAAQPYGTIEELTELVRATVSPQTWEQGGTLTSQGKNIIAYAPPDVQARVAAFLDDLREFTRVMITIEGKLLRIGDSFLRDVGVDLRGVGGANTGPLANLDDVTNGLVNNASAGFDNGEPGVDGGGGALSPSSGLYFNDGSDGDVRARTENIFSTPLRGLLTAAGGGTFEVTYLDDLAVTAIVRATEKTARLRRMRSATVTVYNSQRAYMSVVNEVAYIADYDVEVAQTSFIADPVIGILQEGIVLDVRPIVSDDRQFITLQLGTATMELNRPIATFETSLGAAGAEREPQRPFTSNGEPVSVQLPEAEWETTDSTVRIPNGGSILLSGLKKIGTEDQHATTPILGQIPVLSFLFSRRGKSEEVLSRMAIITATITDLNRP
ncbi:MAG TPA: hypothetical protein VFY93_19265 [Planctomycetota bacterium]|nr:hypothetical protein [Planctomycetota bacterium]